MTAANPLVEDEQAKKIVDRFVRRFGESYRLLVYHAAIPLILTPELLNYLRHQFLRGQVPWVAEVDLLLSDLFEPVGYELYAMDTAVRAYLLKNIEEFFHEQGLEEKHLQEVALVLLGYIKYLARTNSFLDAPELEAQRWAAMVFLEDKKEQIFQEIKKALQNCGSEAELARLTQITQELSPQLSNYPSLIKFAESVRDLLLDLKPDLTETTKQTITKVNQDLEIDLSKFPKLEIREGRRSKGFVSLMMYILHLSDLHFGTQQDADRWYGQLADDLIRDLLSQLESNQPPHLDALIISGDIANKSLPEEYEAAERFINRLLPEFGLQRHQIVIVPGNHDLNWDLSKKAYEIKQRESYEGSLDNEDILNKDIIVDGNYVLVPKQREYEERFKHFSNFYENVIGRPYPRQYGQQYALWHFPEQNLLILGLNSAWKLNHDPKYRACASINPDALTNAIREINKNPAYKNSLLKIAVWHHPLNSPFEDRIKDHGFMEQLAQNGFRLALHGHIHRASKEDFKEEFEFRPGRKIDIIAAGTFGAPVREWVPGYPLQYNLLKWKDNKLTVYTRKRIQINGAWQPDAMWVSSDGITASSFYEIELYPEQPTPKNLSQ